MINALYKLQTHPNISNRIKFSHFTVAVNSVSLREQQLRIIIVSYSEALLLWNWTP